jgi:hypothetical protein
MITRILKVDTPNSNGRIYTREAIETAIEKHAGNPLMISLGVQEKTELDMNRITGVMTNLSIDGDGYLVGEITRLNLPAAETLDKLTDMAYIPVGYGTVGEDGAIRDYTFSYIAVIPALMAAKLEA